MYEERIEQLNTGLNQYTGELTNFLGLLDFVYKKLGLIVEVHSQIDGDEVHYTAMLVDRPSTSVQIVKTFNEDGTQSEWKAIDLTEPE